MTSEKQGEIVQSRQVLNGVLSRVRNLERGMVRDRVGQAQVREDPGKALGNFVMKGF